jgi:hypothetical protein
MNNFFFLKTNCQDVKTVKRRCCTLVSQRRCCTLVSSASHALTHAHKCTNMHAHAHTCAHMHTHAHTAYACIHMIHMHTHTHAHICIHMHTHAYTCTHTRANTMHPPTVMLPPSPPPSLPPLFAQMMMYNDSKTSYSGYGMQPEKPRGTWCNRNNLNNNKQ